MQSTLANRFRAQPESGVAEFQLREPIVNSRFNLASRDPSKPEVGKLLTQFSEFRVVFARVKELVLNETGNLQSNVVV